MSPKIRFQKLYALRASEGQCKRTDSAQACGANIDSKLDWSEDAGGLRMAVRPAVGYRDARWHQNARYSRRIMATLTGAIGTGSKWLLDRIVGAIAATGINPNVLTFLGLVVNFGAAASFAVGKFFLGALIIFFAGFLDMLDGQVARRQNRVTAFGAFYDSTLDRYADMALYMGLLVYYSVSGQNAVRGAGSGGYGRFGDGELRARARGIADSALQSGIHGAAGAAGAADYRRSF